MGNIVRLLSGVELKNAITSYQRFMQPIIEAAAKEKMMLPVKYILYESGEFERVVSEKELEIQKRVDELSEYAKRQCGLI